MLSGNLLGGLNLAEARRDLGSNFYGSRTRWSVQHSRQHIVWIFRSTVDNNGQYCFVQKPAKTYVILSPSASDIASLADSGQIFQGAYLPGTFDHDRKLSSAGISHQGPPTSAQVQSRSIRSVRLPSFLRHPGCTHHIGRGRTEAERESQRFQENMDFPVFHDAALMRSFSRDQRQQGRRIAFVPTMVRIQVCQPRLARYLMQPAEHGNMTCRATSTQATFHWWRLPGITLLLSSRV